MRESRIRVLTLCANYTTQLSYFDDWRDALRDYPGFETIAVDIVASDAKARIRNALGEVDAVVLLHSTNGDTVAYLDRHAEALAGRRVPLVAFVGNEVNLPGSSIGAKRRVLQAIRPEWIATQLLAEAGQFLFGDIASRGVVSIPHALNPAVFQSTTDPAARPIDIGVRANRYPPHIGDDDRNGMMDRFTRLGRERPIKVDISNVRLDRDGWVGFLNRCKGTVSTEAGSWFLERDDVTVEAIRRDLRGRARNLEIANDSALWRIAQFIPRSLRRPAARLFRAAGGRFEYQTATADAAMSQDVLARFFAGRPRPAFYGKCISSRHFDAIGAKTCQLMFRGRFNDILQADRHYIALDHEFRNLDDALRRFLDAAERKSIVDEAYSHVMESHTYAHRMRQLHQVLLEAT
jgi:hypothetical protein